MDAGQRVCWGVTLLRVAVASVFVIHGTARLVLGGLALALGITARPLAAWFGAEIAVGILMVHGPVGWFVVGLGRNGAEYSALILASLAVVALTHDASWRIK